MIATEGGEGIPKAAVESEDSRGALVSAPVSTDGHPLKISFSPSTNLGSTSTQQSGDQDGDAIKGSISSDVLSGDCADDDDDIGQRGGEVEEQHQRPDSFGVESSGRSFGKRISTMGMNISKRVSDGLSHDTDLQCLGFKSEIRDTAMFARGVVQIIRALHCYPCRRAQVEVSRLVTEGGQVV
jgi:hypothetical protein